MWVGTCATASTHCDQYSCAGQAETNTSHCRGARTGHLGARWQRYRCLRALVPPAGSGPVLRCWGSPACSFRRFGRGHPAPRLLWHTCACATSRQPQCMPSVVVFSVVRETSAHPARRPAAAFGSSPCSATSATSPPSSAARRRGTSTSTSSRWCSWTSRPPRTRTSGAWARRRRCRGCPPGAGATTAGAPAATVDLCSARLALGPGEPGQ